MLGVSHVKRGSTLKLPRTASAPRVGKSPARSVRARVPRQSEGRSKAGKGSVKVPNNDTLHSSFGGQKQGAPTTRHQIPAPAQRNGHRLPWLELDLGFMLEGRFGLKQELKRFFIHV